MGGKILEENIETEVEIEYEVDQAKLKKFQDYAGRLIDEYNRKVKVIFDKEAKALKLELQYIIDKYVDSFYSAYTPGSNTYSGSKKNADTGYSSAPYQRLYNLYDAFKIEIEDDDWRVEAGHEFMDPMTGSKGADITRYVFELSLRWGFHGAHIRSGAGVPWWRTPPNWQSWYMPAVQTEPVYNTLMDEAEQAIIKYKEKALEECEEYKKHIIYRIYLRASMMEFYKPKKINTRQ